MGEKARNPIALDSGAASWTRRDRLGNQHHRTKPRDHRSVSRVRDREGREGRASRRQGPRPRGQGLPSQLGATASPGDDRVELTLIGPGPIVRAESAAATSTRPSISRSRKLHRARASRERPQEGAPRQASAGLAARGGDRRLQRHRHHSPADAEVLAASTARCRQPRAESRPSRVLRRRRRHRGRTAPVVIRKKVFPAAPDDGRRRALPHGAGRATTSTSSSTPKPDRPSVVYRRKGWDYGVIGLDDQADAAAPTPRPLRPERRRDRRAMLPA